VKTKCEIITVVRNRCRGDVMAC